MKHFIFNVSTLFLLALIPITTQGQDPGMEEALKDLFSEILSTRNDEVRMRINDSIILLIEKYTASEVIFKHRFENLRYLGQILSPDSKLKIITWNLIMTDGSNKYYCYLVRKRDKGEANEILKLTGENSDDAPRTDITYSAGNWYGALYYAIQPFRKGRVTYYAVLGLDFGSLQISRKIIDIIGFSEEGSLILGKDCFHKDGSTILREVFEYYADGIMTLRFKDKKTIVFDHLAPISSGQKYNPEYYGTEFSFDAYVLKKGSWNFELNYDFKAGK